VARRPSYGESSRATTSIGALRLVSKSMKRLATEIFYGKNIIAVTIPLTRYIPDGEPSLQTTGKDIVTQEASPTSNVPLAGISSWVRKLELHIELDWKPVLAYTGLDGRVVIYGWGS
jgi:hypothetical protein